MTTNVDPYRLQAYRDILASPDPPQMPRRVHRVHYEGQVDRRQKVFLPLIVAWASRRWLEVDGEDCSWSLAKRPNRMQQGRYL